MISAPSVADTAHGPVAYTVTYADANFNNITLAADNIALKTSGTATGSVAVSGAGLTRTVTISSIAGNGYLWFSIGYGTASDLAGNYAPSATAAGVVRRRRAGDGDGGVLDTAGGNILGGEGDPDLADVQRRGHGDGDAGVGLECRRRRGGRLRRRERHDDAHVPYTVGAGQSASDLEYASTTALRSTAGRSMGPFPGFRRR